MTFQQRGYILILKYIFEREHSKQKAIDIILHMTSVVQVRYNLTWNSYSKRFHSLHWQQL